MWCANIIYVAHIYVLVEFWTQNDLSPSDSGWDRLLKVAIFMSYGERNLGRILLNGFETLVIFE